MDAAHAAFTPPTAVHPVNPATRAAAAALAALATLTPIKSHPALNQAFVRPQPAFTLPIRKKPRTPAQVSVERANRRIVDEAWCVFRDRFVDDATINWLRLRKRLNARSLVDEQQLQNTLQWLFSQANDPFTRYLSEEQLDTMKNDIDGEMCGVGIVFNAESHGWRRTKKVVIKYVVRNSPAAEAGLLRGDRITAIDMVSVKRMSFDDATTRLMGKEGKKVLISFRRDGHDIELSVLLTRRRFEVPTVAAERLHAEGIGDIGYLQLREFAANTASQVRRAVREMSGKRPVQAFVLDLRGNAGGLVDKAVEVAKVFLRRESIVVRFVGRDGTMTMERCGWRVFWRPRVNVTKEPIIILVDSETASASELVAAALRDNCRAVVVGNSTYGKGSVQAIVPLSNGAGIAVTVARYKTPRNSSIVMGKGLRPDLFRSSLAEDGDGVVKELFGRGGVRRMRWISGRLGKCIAPSCKRASSTKMAKRDDESSERAQSGHMMLWFNIVSFFQSRR